MVSNGYCFPILIVNFLFMKDAAGFFVKHVDSGMCVDDTKIIQSESPRWGNLSFVDLTNNCLNPTAQFQFRDNGAMLNLKRQGCAAAFTKQLRIEDHFLDMFLIYVDVVSLDRSACAQRPDKKIYRAITQTSGGALSVNFSPYNVSVKKSEPFNIWCAVPRRDEPFTKYYGIDVFLGLTKTCDDAPDKRFNFGSVTCYGNIVKNANCPKDQYIVVKTASYRGLSATKTCGLSDEYSCELNVTCLLKKRCDGQLVCNVTVDDKLFPGDPCPGLTKYLYFEYQCSNSSQSYQDFPGWYPRNIKTTSRSTTSLSLTWDAPEKVDDNEYIISYIVCVSYSLDGHCFKKYLTSDQEQIIRNLKESTKYYVCVLVNTATERSSCCESKVFFTNGRAEGIAISRTSSTLTFSLRIPSQSFKYFYVVVWKIVNGKEPALSGNYENNQLITYGETENSSNPQPYIAAVLTFSSLIESVFVLGDGSSTSASMSERRRSISSDYYNGPLKPGTSYRVFQRFFINEQGDYYSTDWSPISKTNEYTGSPRVLANMSTGNVKTKVGDLVNLLCSAQGEPPISFIWKKNQKILNSFSETHKPHRSSLLVLRIKGNDDFGKYTCHIRDRFESTTHTIWISLDTGEAGNNNETEYLVCIIILAAVLLVIFIFIFTYYFRFNRRKLRNTKQEKKVMETNDARDIYENPDKDDVTNYEDVSNEPSMYKDLNRPAVGTEHVYCHLNEVQMTDT